MPDEAQRVIGNLHVVGIDNQRRKIAVGFEKQGHGLSALSAGNPEPILNGQRIDLESYAQAWADALHGEHSSKTRTDLMPDGVYPETLQEARRYAPGEFLINGTSVTEMNLTLEFDMHLVWPRIRSVYEVATRGRVAFTEPLEVPGAKMELAVIGDNNMSGVPPKPWQSDGALPRC
jgi:hypothetical protein